MTPTQQLLKATEWLRQGFHRFKVQRCGLCGQKNRVDRWRMIFRITNAVCGRCHSPIAYVTGSTSKTPRVSP